MIKLDYRDNRPIYEQIKEEIKKLIIKGAMKKDDKIPSVREMALSLSINPNTIQRSYRELEAEGYIYSKRATGYFVSGVDHEITKEKEKNLREELKNIITELEYLGCKKEEVFSIIEKIYKKG